MASSLFLGSGGPSHFQKEAGKGMTMDFALLFLGSGRQGLLPLGKADALAMGGTVYKAESGHGLYPSLLGKWRPLSFPKGSKERETMAFTFFFLGSGGV